MAFDTTAIAYDYSAHIQSSRGRLWRVAPVTRGREVCITIGLQHRQRSARLAWGLVTICDRVTCRGFEATEGNGMENG